LIIVIVVVVSGEFVANFCVLFQQTHYVRLLICAKPRKKEAEKRECEKSKRANK